MGWIDLAQDSDKWSTFVNSAINLRVPLMRGISWLAEDVLVFQERLQSKELD